VVIVATGVSLLFTCGFTIGLDALVRRWRVRVRGKAPAGEADDHELVVAPGEDPDRTVMGAAQVAQVMSAPRAPAVARPIVPAAIVAAVSANGRTMPHPAPAERRVERPAEPKERVSAPAAAEEPPADQTAVLALPIGGHLGVFQYVPDAKVLPGTGASEQKQGEEQPSVTDARSLPSDATIVLPKTLDDWKQESRGQGR